MSALAALVDALRTGDTLAWMLEHAPDGDADVALRWLWSLETDAALLIEVCHALGASDGDALAARQDHCDRALSRGDVGGHTPGDNWTRNSCCVAVYRRHRACPSLAAWLAKREVRP